LFNYVNELNNEIELLQEQIAEIESDIEKFKQESIDMDEQRELILEDLKVNVRPLQFGPNSRYIVTMINELFDIKSLFLCDLLDAAKLGLFEA